MSLLQAITGIDPGFSINPGNVGGGYADRGFNITPQYTGYNPDPGIDINPGKRKPIDKTGVLGYGVPKSRSTEADRTIGGAMEKSDQGQNADVLDWLYKRNVAKFMLTATPDELEAHAQSLRDQASARWPNESLVHYQERMRSGDYYPAPNQKPGRLRVGTAQETWENPQAQGQEGYSYLRNVQQ